MGLALYLIQQTVQRGDVVPCVVAHYTQTHTHAHSFSHRPDWRGGAASGKGEEREWWKLVGNRKKGPREERKSETEMLTSFSR